MLSRRYIIICLCIIQFNFGAQTSNSRGFLDFLFSPCKCRCGVPNREARLVGGEFLRGHEFPWLALVQHKTAALPGTLINDKYVITAASTIIGLTPYDIKVTLGQFDRCFPDISSINSSVDQIIVHPDFSPGNRANDLALIKLSGAVRFERRISPVCLPTPGRGYLGQVATAVGWSQNGGTTEGEVVSSCRPRKVGLAVLGHDECLGTAFDPLFISADKGCIGVVGSPSVICRPDAGGPIMYRSYDGIYELIGVLTDKNECGNKPSTALYTNINQHLGWITQMTKDSCYCTKT